MYILFLKIKLLKINFTIQMSNGEKLFIFLFFVLQPNRCVLGNKNGLNRSKSADDV